MPAPTPVDNNKLIFSVLSQLKIPQLDWAAVSKNLGCTPRAARERWDRLLKKELANIGKAVAAPKKQTATLSSVQKASGAAVTKPPVKKSSAKGRKRKAADHSSDDVEEWDGGETGDDDEVADKHAATQLTRKKIGPASKKMKQMFESQPEFGHEDGYAAVGWEEMGDDGKGFATAEEGEYQMVKNAGPSAKKIKHHSELDFGSQQAHGRGGREDMVADGWGFKTQQAAYRRGYVNSYGQDGYEYMEGGHAGYDIDNGEQ